MSQTIYDENRETGNVELYWWNERASYPLDRETIGVIDEWAQEFFNC